MNNSGQNTINTEGASDPHQNVDHINSYIDSLLHSERVALRRRIISRVGLSSVLGVALTFLPSCETGEPIDSSFTPTATNSTEAYPPTSLSASPLDTPTAPSSTPEQIPTAQETQTYPDSRFESVASWSQDFSKMNNGPLDESTWNIINGPPFANQEKQYYTDSPNNVRIENGLLVLEAHKRGMDGYNYTSGRINTLGNEDFMYGKIEVTAKLPIGVGTWPAIWMTPSDNIYAGKPIPQGANRYYLNGELDIAETSGVEPNNIYCIAHSLDSPTDNPYPNKYFSTLMVPDSNTAFHNYGISWTPDEITFTIDGNECYSVTKSVDDGYMQWPYDQPYNLIINLAIGGQWYTGDPTQYPPDGIDQSMFPVQMQVGAIRYFPLMGQ